MSQETIDWDKVRGRVHMLIQRKLGREDRDTIEDLTQVATIHLLRFSRRAEIRELHGLEVTIAMRTVASFLRRRTFERAHFQGMEGAVAFDVECSLPVPAVLEQTPEVLELVVQEILKRGRPGCLPLWRAYKDLGDWKRVAARLGKGHDAVRKSWSRCLKFLRAQLARDPRHAAWMAG